MAGVRNTVGRQEGASARRREEPEHCGGCLSHFGRWGCARSISTTGPGFLLSQFHCFVALQNSSIDTIGSTKLRQAFDNKAGVAKFIYCYNPHCLQCYEIVVFVGAKTTCA